MTGREFLDIYAGSLSAEQLEAVLSDTSTVVSAGAGSGKTTVLSLRFVRLVLDGKAHADEILTITFTKKAAAEMYERIHLLLEKAALDDERMRKELDEHFPKARISTMDSFWSEIARTDSLRYGITRDFSSLEDEDESDMIERIYTSLQNDEKCREGIMLLSELYSSASILSFLKAIASETDILTSFSSTENTESYKLLVEMLRKDAEKDAVSVFSRLADLNAEDDDSKEHDNIENAIALFSSADGTGWSFESILDRNQGRYGKMWECPDFFTLDSRQVLIVSPQFMRAEGQEFHNGNNSIYFVGSYEKEKKCFLRKEARQIDHGLDFYAPQTLETADGRRIMIAWMKSWDNDLTPEGAGWSGMMTVPRELRLDGERLIQNPVRELETYRRNEVRHAVRLTREDGEKALDGISGRVLDMTVELKAGDYEVFQIALAADSDSRTLLVYDRKRATLTTDRTWSGLRKDQVCVRSAAVREREGKLKLRIVMDRFSAEVFVNDGETAMSTVIHTDQKAQGIFFSCDGTAEISVVKYDLEAEGLTF